LAGAAVLAGGYAAWHHHEEKNKNKNKEEVEEEVSPLFIIFFWLSLPCLLSSKQKVYTWGLQAWLREAHQCTDNFRKNGPRGPTTWILVETREDIPPQALDVGRDRDGNSIHIARVFYEDGLRTFSRLYFLCLCSCLMSIF